MTQSGSLRCEGASCASQMDRVTKAGSSEIITLQKLRFREISDNIKSGVEQESASLASLM